MKHAHFENVINIGCDNTLVITFPVSGWHQTSGYQIIINPGYNKLCIMYKFIIVPWNVIWPSPVYT